MKDMMLPVFFHIPKNAGTYIYNRSFNIVKQLVNTKQKTYNLEVKKEGLTSYLIVCSSDKDLSDKYKVMNGASWVCVDYEDLQLDDLNLHFIEVCDQSFGSYKDDIYKKLNKDIELLEFLSLRDPYERVLSLFSYLKSTQSSHESTSGVFDGMEIVDYLNSSYLEGSWLIRSFLNIPNEIPITQLHFDQVCKILDGFLISDVKDVDILISKVFNKCYDIKDCGIKQQNIYSNKTKIKVKCDFDSLDQQTKDHFNNQTKWDRLLFEKYTQ